MATSALIGAALRVPRCIHSLHSGTPTPPLRQAFIPSACLGLSGKLPLIFNFIGVNYDGLLSEVLGTVSIMFDWQRSRRGQVQFLYTKCRSSAIAFFNNFILYQTRV